MPRIINAIKVVSKVVAIIIAFPVVWLLSRYGSDVSRTRGGVLQTPVRYLQHPETGRKVTLVGAIHIGKKSYYGQMQDLVDQAAENGHTILYEGVGQVDKEDVAKMPASQQIVVKQMQQMMSLMAWMSEHCFEENVIYQKQGLSYPKSWIRTDLELSDVARLMSDAGVTMVPEGKDGADLSIPSGIPVEAVSVIRKVAGIAITLLPGIHRVSGWLKVFSKRQQARDHIIINLRDDVATAGILQHAAETDVVSIWGAAHLPGIETRLAAEGYQRKSTVWLDAFWS